MDKQLKRVNESMSRAASTRSSLNCKFSSSMHKQNLLHSKGSHERCRVRKYLPTKDAYDRWNAKIDASWENDYTRRKAMARIYGKNSSWGRLEELERQRLLDLNRKSVESETPDLSPLEYKRAVYNATKAVLLINTNVHEALVQHTQSGEINDLLERAKAAAVVQRALRKFQKRSWERKMVKIDPILKDLVDQERGIERSIYLDTPKRSAYSGNRDARPSACSPKSGDVGRKSDRNQSPQSTGRKARTVSVSSSLTPTPRTPPRARSRARTETASSYSLGHLPLSNSRDRASSSFYPDSVSPFKKMGVKAIKDAVEFQVSERERRETFVNELSGLITGKNIKKISAGGTAASTSPKKATQEGIMSHVKRRSSVIRPFSANLKSKTKSSTSQASLPSSASLSKRRPSTANYRRNSTFNTMLVNDQLAIRHHESNSAEVADPPFIERKLFRGNFATIVQ